MQGSCAACKAPDLVYVSYVGRTGCHAPCEHHVQLYAQLVAAADLNKKWQ